jgi:hypothetical protein
LVAYVMSLLVGWLAWQSTATRLFNRLVSGHPDAYARSIRHFWIGKGRQYRK